MLITFPYFQPFGGFLQKTEKKLKKPPIFARKCANESTTIDFFQKGLKSTGKTWIFTWCMPKVPRKPPSWWKSAKTKNEGFFENFCKFFMFFAFFSRISWIFFGDQNLSWNYRSIHFPNCLRIFSRPNGLASTAAQTLVVRPIFLTFWPIFAIFSTFCAFTQPFVDGFSHEFFVLKAEVPTLLMVSIALL